VVSVILFLFIYRSHCLCRKHYNRCWSNTNGNKCSDNAGGMYVDS